MPLKLGKREIFQNILDDTEEHIDWIETRQGLIEKTGDFRPEHESYRVCAKLLSMRVRQTMKVS